jgi:hypothetical protein
VLPTSDEGGGERVAVTLWYNDGHQLEAERAAAKKTLATREVLLLPQHPKLLDAEPEAEAVPEVVADLSGGGGLAEGQAAGVLLPSATAQTTPFEASHSMLGLVEDVGKGGHTKCARVNSSCKRVRPVVPEHTPTYSMSVVDDAASGGKSVQVVVELPLVAYQAGTAAVLEAHGPEGAASFEVDVSEATLQLRVLAAATVLYSLSIDWTSSLGLREDGRGRGPWRVKGDEVRARFSSSSRTLRIRAPLRL